MRKRAKGAPPSEVAPSSPPPTPSELPATTRLCWYCNNKPAVGLVEVNKLHHMRVFCSMRCSALAALQLVGVYGKLTWCNDHRMWSDAKGRCPSCRLMAKGFATTLLPGSSASARPVEEVDHE